jgi:hypothetical protein
MALVTYLIPELSKVKVTAFPLEVAEAGIVGIGEWDYPRYSLEGSAYQPGRATGDWTYPSYSFVGYATDGAPYLPPIYLIAPPVTVKVTGEPIEYEPVRLSQPVAGVWDYPQYGLSGRVEFVGVAVGAWDYLRYSAEGVVQQDGAVIGDWEYPRYSLFGGANSAEGAWDYPRYGLDGFVSSGAIGDWEYSRYTLEGVIAEVPDNAVIADLVYPQYGLDGNLIQQNYGSLVADYWSYSMTGEVGIQYGDGELEYPTYGLSGEVVQYGSATGDWEYPRYSLDGVVDKYGFVGEFNYPGYSMEGTVVFPGVGVGIWSYALNYSVSGLIVKANVRKRKQLMVVKRNGHD